MSRTWHTRRVWIIVLAVLVIALICAVAILSARHRPGLQAIGAPEHLPKTDSDVIGFRSRFDAEGNPMDFEQDLRRPLNEQELL